LVDPTDTQAIADALRRLITSAALRQHLRAAGLQHARRYSWAASAAAYANLMRHVARAA